MDVDATQDVSENESNNALQEAVRALEVMPMVSGKVGLTKKGRLCARVELLCFAHCGGPNGLKRQCKVQCNQSDCPTLLDAVIKLKTKLQSEHSSEQCLAAANQKRSEAAQDQSVQPPPPPPNAFAAIQQGSAAQSRLKVAEKAAVAADKKLNDVQKVSISNCCMIG